MPTPGSLVCLAFGLILGVFGLIQMIRAQASYPWSTRRLWWYVIGCIVGAVVCIVLAVAAMLDRAGYCPASQTAYCVVWVPIVVGLTIGWLLKRVEAQEREKAAQRLGKTREELLEEYGLQEDKGKGG